MPCSDTIHPLFIIVEILWLEPVVQVGKQAVVTQTEIRAMRMVVRQLPGEVRQQACAQASVCGHILSRRSTVLYVSIPPVNAGTQAISYMIIYKAV